MRCSPSGTRFPLALAALSLLVLSTPALAEKPAPRPWTVRHEVPGPRTPLPARVVRALGDHFEIATSKGAHEIFFRGVNLGAGPPGHFPGEFAITRNDYRRWLRFARTLHANAIRVYALHPPAFYQALREENEAHPGDPIWLFQEIWTELPEKKDFWDSPFMRAFEDEIRIGIDAIHGNAVVLKRSGRASGRYDADVSPWLAGWILGREWEPYAVRETQALHPDTTRFHGTYFEVKEGTAMEVWLARLCDLAASYERKRYRLARAVSFVNWPTLDPMRHPTEAEAGGGEADHDEDAYSVDPARIHPLRPAGRGSRFLGYFATYHAYPYYPDFMNLDPVYAAFQDRHGACSFAGYLADLKAHTPNLPLLLGEYGVPSSRGIAHLQPQGINHGGASEEEQGERDVRLLEDIADAGCAGSLLFALFDEWFKVNWLVAHVEKPRDRDPLWLNLLDPEENYGLIGFDPQPAIRIDGMVDDWAGVKSYASALDSAGARVPLRALYATSDESRFYLRIDLTPNAVIGGAAGARETPRHAREPAPTPPAARGGGIRTIGVSLDVLDPDRGDRRLPAPLRATWSRGAEFLLLFEAGTSSGGPFRGGLQSIGRAELFVDRSMNFSTYSRLITGRGFERNDAPFHPVPNDDGLFVPLLIETNRERISRSGVVYPAQILDWGRLEHGRESALTSPRDDMSYAFNPHIEWCLNDSGSSLEVAIPWGLLNVGDPSSRSVLDNIENTPDVEVSATQGIGILAWATSAPGFAADSLGPTVSGARTIPPDQVFYLGPKGTAQTIAQQEVTITSPNDSSYLWNGWDRPIIRERVKRSAGRIKQAFEEMDARERGRSTDLDSGKQ